MIKSNITKQIAFSLTLIGAIAFASTALADSGASDYESAQQINAANELLRKGEIDQAIEGYSNVANSEANRDELKYNMAVAQYRKSDIPAATSLFNETAGSADASIAARSRFNLGNCLYATALQTAEQDKPAAIEQLRTAISHFRGSLRSMPDNEDARANIELAAELIRKLEDEQKQEEQKQDQQQQDSQDSQSQDSKSDQSQQDNQQKEQSEESKSEESSSDQSKSDESKSDESNSDQSKSDESKADEQNKNESEQNDSENKSEQQQAQDSAQQEQPEQPSPSQPNAEQNQAEKQPPNKQSRSNAQQSKEDEASLDEQPQDNQPVPTGELTAADQQDDNKEPNGSVAMADPNAKDDGLMTKEEALKMLQAVRDRDMLRRLRQQQRERSRNIPVDRNW